jgi:hypothetical protein
MQTGAARSTSTTKRPAAFIWLTTLLLVLSSWALAQHGGTLGSRFFDVAISENSKPLLAEAYYHDTDGLLIVQGPPLATVIAKAYELESYQVVDGPEWIRTSHLYDIRATPPPASLTASSETAMLQTLLADRFKLTTQRAQREVTTLALVLAPTTDAAAKRSGYAVGLDMLAERLSLYMGEPVRNLTGSVALSALEPGKGLALNMPFFLEAIREQMGLTVEPRTTMMEVLIVTGIERPLLNDQATPVEIRIDSR